MKKYAFIGMSALFASLLITSTGICGFDIPFGVYRIDQLEQAQKDAEAHNKQIVFLYSDEKTTCPLCARASTAVIDKFKLSSVIVYFDRGGWQKAPRIVKEAINSPESGKYIPKAVVVNAAMTEVASIIPYERASGVGPSQ